MAFIVLFSDRLRLLVVALLFLLTSSGIAFSAERYGVGPQDHLRLRVVEWRAAIDEIHNWEAINGTYVVGPDGNLFVPLIGEVYVAKKSMLEIASIIARELQQKMNLATPPDVTVEVEKYRPFYLTGIVDKPGEYDYRPGITIIQALSLGGGIRRIQDAGLLQLQQERLRSAGEIRKLGRNLNGLKALQERLNGELSGVDKLVFPEHIVEGFEPVGHSDLIETETTKFDARKKAYDEKRSTLVKQKDLLAQQLNVYSDQKKNRLEEVGFIKAELDNHMKFHEKKLVTNLQHLRLLQKHSLATAELLEVENQTLKTKQRLEDVLQQLDDFENQRKIVLVEGIADVKSNIENTMSDLHSVMQIYRHVLMNGAVVGSEIFDVNGKQLRYKIVRHTGGVTRTIPVSESTPILPGDVVVFEIGEGNENGMTTANDELKFVQDPQVNK